MAQPKSMWNTPPDFANFAAQQEYYRNLRAQVSSTHHNVYVSSAALQDSARLQREVQGQNK